ncbi:hypothetical protein O181_046065 [Austropuccinia psidii MF-1]|uniref:Uncharacterized protein n=1 Tax=Austropuccinia psidii MF-1 TaxID=1389203 RepID=A0A9Q3HLT5_9BASI|nr:hypothetical protein [Austropuccinia psidii MF-1]
MPVWAEKSSNLNHYACTSSQQFKKLATAVQAPSASHRIPYVVQVPDNLTVFLCRCRHPKVDTQILTLVKVPDNAENFLHLCRLPTIHMLILTLVNAPHNAKNSLCQSLCL